MKEIFNSLNLLSKVFWSYIIFTPMILLFAMIWRNNSMKIAFETFGFITLFGGAIIVTFWLFN